MTNYNKALVQIITQKQKFSELYKKNLKDVSLALKADDATKAKDLLEIYKTSNSIISSPETQEKLNQLTNPILASFLSNRIVGTRSAHIDITINISPKFGKFLYQT